MAHPLIGAARALPDDQIVSAGLTGFFRSYQNGPILKFDRNFLK